MLLRNIRDDVYGIGCTLYWNAYLHAHPSASHRRWTEGLPMSSETRFHRTDFLVEDVRHELTKDVRRHVADRAHHRQKVISPSADHPSPAHPPPRPPPPPPFPPP